MDNLAPWKFLKIFVCFLAQRPKGAQTPSNCHISPKCWQNISNTSICIQLTHGPQSSASPTQRPKGAQTPSNCHISPKCWQNIFNTNIYIQLTHVPQSSARRAHRHPPTVIYPPNVGRIYPVQIYVILLYHMFLNLQLQLQLNDFFWIRCQIVRGAKLSVFCWWCQIVRCQIVLVPNCPWC